MDNHDNPHENAADHALDLLLGKAPAIENTGALKDRIMNIAAGTEQAATARIIAFPQAAASPAQDNMRWATAALLAASLFVGIWAGASGVADALVSAPLSIAGLDILGESEFYKSGLSAAEDLL